MEVEGRRGAPTCLATAADRVVTVTATIHSSHFQVQVHPGAKKYHLPLTVSVPEHEISCSDQLS